MLENIHGSLGNMLKNVMYTLSVLRVFLYSFSCTHLWTCGLKDPLTQTRRLTHATMANTGGQYMASSYSHLLIKMGIQSTSPSLTFPPFTDRLLTASPWFPENIMKPSLCCQVCSICTGPLSCVNHHSTTSKGCKQLGIKVKVTETIGLHNL